MVEHIENIWTVGEGIITSVREARVLYVELRLGRDRGGDGLLDLVLLGHRLSFECGELLRDLANTENVSLSARVSKI